MLGYLAVRCCLAAFFAARGVAEIGWRIELLSWLAFAGYTIFIGLRWANSKILRRTQQTIE
jgi:hypothetical protein